MVLENVPYELVASVVILLSILIVSFKARGRVFCQYLNLMTGIRVTPGEVMTVFREKGKAGVRELFLDLLIRADLEETPRITPDTQGEKPVASLINR